MSDELRMDLADCASPEAIIAAILKHHPGLTLPVPIEDLARAVGIEEITEMESDRFQGALLTNPEKSRGAIVVHKNARGGRRRFTIGHELGHFLIPYHRGNKECTPADMRVARSNDPARKIEAEANRFAAGILMPKPYFRKDMRRLGDADVAHALELKRLYGTSLEATVNRYAELTDDRCAFVLSQNGLVRYVRPTRDFPRLAVKSKTPLPPGSVSAGAPASPLRRPSPWSEIDRSVWLDLPDGARVPRLLEQSMRQAEGYQITLLFLDAAADEEDEDAAEMEDRWNPRFR